MNGVVRLVLGSILLLAYSSSSADADGVPRTGFFNVEFSPLELLGEPGANNFGNRVGVGKRMFLAMLAPKILANNYVLDLNRIYVAGFSGGGKTASRVSSAKPDVFRGAIYIAGAAAWGASTPPPKLDVIKQNYHVFLTGTNDFNERLTRRVYASYKAAGVENCELIVVNRLGHELPGRSIFARAIDYLDSRYSESPE